MKKNMARLLIHFLMRNLCRYTTKQYAGEVKKYENKIYHKSYKNSDGFV